MLTGGAEFFDNLHRRRHLQKFKNEQKKVSFTLLLCNLMIFFFI